MADMDLWAAVILGIVEGVTEFLPVSSTGHLILTGKILALPDTDFLKSALVVIQLGAILAVIVLYGKSFLVDVKVLKHVAVAFLPTMVIGLVLYRFIKDVLLGSATIVVWSLLLGGVALIVFELCHRDNPKHKDVGTITYRQAFLIGVIQTFAVIPGVSRSGATIVGGLLLGLSRTAAAEFSFLLAVPTMAAASALDIKDSAMNFTASQFGFLVVGFLVSFVVALAVIKGFVAFLKRSDFIIFGVYRIIFALGWMIFHAGH